MSEELETQLARLLHGALETGGGDFEPSDWLPEARAVLPLVADLQRRAEVAEAKVATVRVPWKDEFNRRCRRLLGVTDDSVPVDVQIKNLETAPGQANAAIIVRVGADRMTVYDDFGDLLNDLDDNPDAVPDETAP